MPNAYIKSLAKETKKSVAQIEKLWDKAKEITSDTFNKKESDFEDREYAYTTGVIKNMLGIEESDERVSKVDVSKFVNSNLTAREFIESVVSGNFTIGNVVNKSDDEDEEEISEEDSEEEDLKESEDKDDKSVEENEDEITEEDEEKEDSESKE